MKSKMRMLLLSALFLLSGCIASNQSATPDLPVNKQLIIGSWQVSRINESVASENIKAVFDENRYDLLINDVSIKDSVIDYQINEQM